MKELMIKELMIHVEKIVRPVTAFAGRKLRMRRELLNHLQAAFEEERSHAENATGAFERATMRLGKPDELTQSLQHSVPWIERTLMAKLRVPRAVERFEKRSMRWLNNCPLTPMQSVILGIGATLLLTIGCMSPALGSHLDRKAAQLMMFDRPLTWLLFNLATTGIVFGGFAVCARFIVAVATGGKHRAAYGAVITALPSLSMILALGCINRRAVTPGDLTRGIIVGLFVVAAEALLGMLIAKMRRPYAEWLLLDVAA